jgi:D-alanine-D-alanine ligase
MTAVMHQTDLPILLLYDLDRTCETPDLDEVLREVLQLASGLSALGHPVVSLEVSDAQLACALSRYDPGEHVVFNWCECLPGIARRDVLVARTLSALGFTYTGSTAPTLALSWDKARAKNRLERYGVPTPYARVYRSTEPDGWDRFPAIVKPAIEHRSIGVTPESVVLTPQELHERVAYVIDAFREPALVEEFIDGRELHVSLLGNGEVRMLPPAEMDFSAFADVRDRLCSFDSKFKPGSRHYEQIQLRLPASLDAETLERVEQAARRAYRAPHCRDYARLDLRLRDGVPYILDVNPNADITSSTSTALAAQLAGFSHAELVSHLVSLAALRHPTFAGHRF